MEFKQRIRNRQFRAIKANSGSWHNLVAPHGYRIFRGCTFEGFRLTSENRPYGINKSHVLREAVSEPITRIDVDEESLEWDLNSEFDSGLWIAANDWKHPDDPLPLDMDKVNVASRGFLVDSAPAIHRQFGEVQINQGGILGFCLECGFLGQRTLLVKNRDNGTFWAESYSEWVAELHKMRILLKLLDLMKKRAPAELMRKYVEITVSYAYISNRNQIEETAISGDLIEGFDLRYIPPEEDEDGLEFRAVKTVFHGLLRRAIRETCTPDFRLERGAEIQLQPKSLLGAIYLSLLDEVLGDSEPVRRCAVCGEYFELLHDRTQYCSGRCRQKAYRNRNKETNDGE
jgi:predicted nucleic acid-binding Zn ribbon protein